MDEMIAKPLVAWLGKLGESAHRQDKDELIPVQQSQRLENKSPITASPDSLTVGRGGGGNRGGCKQVAQADNFDGVGDKAHDSFRHTSINFD